MIQKRGYEKTIEEVILRNTGYQTIEELTSPDKNYYIKDLDKVADRIRLAVENHTPITVVGDYDVDGITASSIMLMTLKHLGADVKIRLPRRLSEGFGLSEKIVDEIDSGLLITVDNGIAAIDAVKKAKEKGLEVIVTDHHEPVYEGDVKILPEADIIIDPHAIEGQAEFNGYCGAGLAYKLSSELVKNEVFNDKMSCFAALGTVSDVMKLVEDNRLIVQKGLKNMVTKGHHTDGLESVLNKAYASEYVTAKDIGFKIGPMLNAAGRLLDDGAEKPLKVLTTDGLRYPSYNLADELDEYNKKRKLIIANAMPKIEEEIAEEGMEYDFPLVIYNSEIPEGIVGLIAGRLTEEYDTPAFVFANSMEPEIMKGSARTARGVNIKELLDKTQKEFYKYGGHAEAAGVSLFKSNFLNAKKALQKNCYEPLGYVKDNTLYYDIDIEADTIKDAAELLEKYGPFGEGNAEITFKIKNFTLTDVSLLGTDGKYIKVYGKNNICAFGSTDKYINCLADGLLYDVSLECQGTGIKKSTYEKLKYLIYLYTNGLTNENGLEKMYERIQPNDGFKKFTLRTFDEMSKLPQEEQKMYNTEKMLQNCEKPKRVDIIGTLSANFFKHMKNYQIDMIKMYDPEKVLEKEKEVPLNGIDENSIKENVIEY